MIRININEGDSTEKALRKFKRKVEQAAILKEIKKREFHLKPSIKNKLKRRATTTRIKKREKKICKKFFV